MKQFFYLLAIYVFINGLGVQAQSLAITNYFQNNTRLGGEGVIKQAIVQTDENTTSITFEVEMPQSGNYQVAFWVCPTELPDGTFATYDVSVNQNSCGQLVFNQGDWQNVTISGHPAIPLHRGINKIAIFGTAPDVPNVEHVKIASNITNAQISNDMYERYRETILAERQKSSTVMHSRRNEMDSTLGNRQDIMLSSIVYDDPLYDFEYALDIPIKYTFYKIVSFVAGQYVLLLTTGVDNFAHVLECFSSSKPFQYSWSALSNSNCMASLSIYIPETGTYYVRVRSYKNGQSGFCNLNVNCQNYYSNIPIFSRGVRSVQNSGITYNSFTCKGTGDPFLWVEEGSSIPGKIYCFNDDYNTSLSLFWGHNSRVKTAYTRTVHSVLLSTHSSYSPTTQCDVYARCKTADEVLQFFPLLKSDDAIQSSPASSKYNCIAWTGGITSSWEWPSSTSSSFYYDSLTYDRYNPKTHLMAFDSYYSWRGLTRTGANADNGKVALWAQINPDGSIKEYTHASITKGADCNAHGYSWESKAGQLMRFFHPKNAIGGTDGYGQIVEYYIPMESGAMTLSLEEQVANNEVLVEYIDFTQEEKTLINRKISAINKTERQTFETAYDNWQKTFDKSVNSNPDLIKDCDAYRKVLSLCRSNNNLMDVLYQKVASNEIASVFLIEDLVYDKYVPIVKDVQALAKNKLNNSDVIIYRPILTNAKEIVRRILSAEMTKYTKSIDNMTENYSYSNETEFNVYSSANTIEVLVNLQNEQSTVSLDLLNTSGYILNTAISNQILNRGSHTFTLRPNGENVYLVRLTIDGKINVKKVSLKP
ncbi:MAG: hypothetical protein ACI3Z7_06985 [Candidatus Aphodosoma sp.]